MKYYESKYTGAEVDALLGKVESGEVGGKVTVDWNASEEEAGHIKGRSHLINGAHAIPFEQWDKRFDEDGNVIYFQTLPSDNYSGCLIREGGVQEENYIFFGTEWKSLHPAVSADIRINYDYDSGDSVLEIKLYRESDSESFLATFINNALFAYGQGEDFILPIAKEFIPNTIARQESVDELREETTALWENLDHGTFPNLTAGDLAGRGESVPAEFGFRASGGKSIKDGRAYLKAIKGNSVVWNQILNNLAAGLADKTETDTEVRIIPTDANSNRFGNGVNVIEGHYYLQMVDILSEEGTLVGFQNYLNLNCNEKTTSTSYVKLWQIAQASASGISYIQLWSIEGTPYRIKKDSFNLIDLTRLFGAGKEPTTIEEYEARKPIVEDEFAYNEGEVIHCNTESIKSVGDNAWDEQWENGYIYGEGEVSNDGTSGIISKNFIPVLANEEYYYVYPQGAQFLFIVYYDHLEHYISQDYLYASNTRVTPTNAAYIKFFAEGVPTYNHDILIRLNHSGWKQGYQPYWQDTLPLPIIRKYFPDGMKLAGSAHDEIRFNKASGKWEYSKGKIKSVDFGTLEWQYASGAGWGTGFYASIQNAFNSNQDIICISARYLGVSGGSLYGTNNTTDKVVAIEDGKTIRLHDYDYTDAASLKASLQGVMLYYESNDWEWVELDAEDQNFRDYYNVADFGTEMSQSEVPSAAFSADIIYQFNAVDMIREHEAEINELQSIIATMQAQLASLTHNT